MLLRRPEQALDHHQALEAMAGDVIFDKKLQRTINVDIRYVLWVIENFSGAKHIVDELDIVSK